ncbi:RRM3 [Symbiodinium natans]|uniref:RRM3 protein n=1 Tax=Symbiodinium natans TaxID=878477 RepID=A0A812M134_9DINO|nr:RRM3 [Symbiodinium natans]
MAAALDFKLVSVEEASTVKELCEAHDVPYSTGCGYYKLERKENISSSKGLVAYKEGKPTRFVCGNSEVRKILGLAAGNITLAPKDIKSGWALYVQSTSNNRKLPSGCSALLSGGKAEAKTAGAKKRPASAASSAATSSKAARKGGAAKFPILWDKLPGDGEGERFVKTGSTKQMHYVDQEVDSIDRSRLDAALDALAASVKAAKWTAEGATLTAPGGFRMQTYTEAPGIYVLSPDLLLIGMPTCF